MLDLHVAAEARPKAKPSRDWSFIATVVALIGMVAGYGVVNSSFEPPPHAENYVSRRAFNEYAAIAVGLVAALAPFVSIVIGITARAWLGALSGVLSLLFIFVWLPSQLRACCGGDEANMIGVLRAINSAQQAYSSSCGNGYYASDLEVLLKPPLTGGTAFTSVDVGKGYWRGYRVTMQAKDSATTPLESCNGTRVGAAGYFVEAHHTDPKLGRRSFATDERGAVYQNTDGTVIHPGMAGAQPIQ